MFDTVVIGGGVAGLTAALFAARGGCSTLVLLPLPGIPGGELVTIDRVEDFPGFPDGIAGYELGPKLQEQVANAGADFHMAEATGLQRADGGWRVETAEGGIEATAFHRLSDDDWEGLAAEARSLLALLADREPAVYRRYDRWWRTLPGAEDRLLPGN